MYEYRYHNYLCTFFNHNSRRIDSGNSLTMTDSSEIIRTERKTSPAPAHAHIDGHSPITATWTAKAKRISRDLREAKVVTNLLPK